MWSPVSVSQPCWEPKQGLLQNAQRLHLEPKQVLHHHYVVELILVILKAFPTSTVAPAGKPCQARLWGGGFQNFFASIAAVILWHGKSSHTQKKGKHKIMFLQSSQNLHFGWRSSEFTKITARIARSGV